MVESYRNQTSDQWRNSERGHSAPWSQPTDQEKRGVVKKRKIRWKEKEGRREMKERGKRRRKEKRRGKEKKEGKGKERKKEGKKVFEKEQVTGLCLLYLTDMICIVINKQLFVFFYVCMYTACHNGGRERWYPKVPCRIFLNCPTMQRSAQCQKSAHCLIT